LSKEGNGDYFRGADQVRRVAVVAEEPSGVLEGKKPKSPSSQGTQPIDYQRAKPDQSSCNVLRGLAGALQEDIALTTRQLLLRGRNILGGVSPETTQMTLPFEPC
jgi:hypothetical protein